MSPLLIAIILVATALGVVVPLLEDAGESSSYLGDQYSGECGTKQRRELQTR